ncbi:MAG: PPK2 family polyphosphate kinase [Jatrophihabitantaceae bacterium]
MTKDTTSLRDALAFANTSRQLADIDTAAMPMAPTKRSGLPKKLKTKAKRIAALQEQLWAEATAGGRRSVLIVLQGIDTAGKGGTTEHVIGACGPIGVEYTGFKKPTKEELRHDFLWRIRKRLPAPGVVGIFDRSHYEDVLVVRVHDLAPQQEWESRYDTINAFERDLVAHGTTVLKVFLHISYDAQRDRLLRRLRRPDKHWKFNEADLDERALWPRYQDAFQDMLQRCDTADAPWYVVPSDSKDYRNWAVGRLLHETLESLDPHYPDITLDVPALRTRLAPPN